MSKNVVIIGGGIFGATVAKLLDTDKSITLTLIEKREALNYKIGTMRAITAGGIWADRAAIPYTKLLKNPNSKIIQKTVGKVTENEIIFDDNTTQSFDALIIATGAINIGPGEAPEKYKTREEIIEYYKKTAEQLYNSKNIAIIGGGAVGIEIAGELNNIYGRDKNITIIHNGETLLSAANPALPAKFLKDVLNTLQNVGIQVLLNQKAIEPIQDPSIENGIMQGDFIVKTSKGDEVKADTIIYCIGTKHYNKSLYPKEWLDSEYNNLIAVDEHFKVKNSKNVFAIGDCNNIKEGKNGGLASMEAPILAKNISAFLAGKKMTKTYKANTMAFMLLPMGHEKGISLLPFGAVGNWMTSLIKGRGLFEGMYWKQFNLTVPDYGKNWLEKCKESLKSKSNIIITSEPQDAKKDEDNNTKPTSNAVVEI